MFTWLNRKARLRLDLHDLGSQNLLPVCHLTAPVVENSVFIGVPREISPELPTSWKFLIKVFYIYNLESKTPLCAIYLLSLSNNKLWFREFFFPQGFPQKLWIDGTDESSPVESCAINRQWAQSFLLTSASPYRIQLRSVAFPHTPSESVVRLHRHRSGHEGGTSIGGAAATPLSSDWDG